MSSKKHYFSSFRHNSVYKQLKGLVTAGLFLTGNLVSTLPAMAAPTPSANIVVDTAPPINQRPTIDVTHNGIDQVNIVHPNDAGVSHNKFNRYNVHEKGQILNNSPTITNTQLAGQITGNPHLKDGKTANTIINEVTGYSPTKLLGYTEVAGKQAAVIIANPNGITCAGCGFINTSRASLATGRTNLDANGHLHSITVGGGEVGFDGAGGNFAEVPVLDIISRKVRIDAPVKGQDIRVVAGRNSYHYTDGTATPLASDGSQTPEFAIETSALGGMTGNHIQMLVNEKGAGVRVDGRMASTAGDMQLTADGKLVIAGELSAQSKLNAHVDVVENTGTIGANNGISLQANALTNIGKIAAVGDQESNIAVTNHIDNSGSITTNSGLKVTATQVNNTQSATIHAQKDLTITSKALNNSGKISTDTGTLSANINGNISNNNGQIASNNNIMLSAMGDLDNINGQIASTQSGNITIQSNNLNNQGGLIQNNTGLLNLTLNSLNNNNGSIVANNAPIIIHALQYILNNNGQIGSEQSGNVTLTTQNDLQNSHGKISTGTGDISIQSNRIINSSGKIVTGADKGSGELTLRSGDIENSNGVIQATAGSIDAGIGNYTDSNSGLIYAGKHLQINASGDMSISNAIQGGEGLSLSAKSLSLSNAEASLSSLSGNGMIMLVNGLINVGTIFVNQGELSIIAGSVSNQNQISTNAGSLSIAANNGDLSNHSGRILTKNDAITLTATGKLDNSASGQIGSLGNGNITLKSGDLNNQSGLIRTSVGDVSLDVGSLNNNNGSILTASGTMRVNALQGINNNSGQIGTQQNGNVTITANGNIDNRQGHFVTPVGLLKITGNALDNSSGQIGSNNGNVDIDIQSNRLINSSGTIIAGADNNAGDLTLTSGDVENSRGTLQATNGSVNATIGSYTDTEKGVVYAGKDLQFNASGDVSIANAIQSQDQFTLQANKLIIANKDASISSLRGNGSLTIINDLINNGAISFAKGSLALDTGSFSNNGSFDIGFGGLNFNIKGDFSNKNGSLIADASDVTITAKGSVDNTNGQIGVKNKGNVTINSQDLLNQGGLIRTGDGDVLLTVANLNNQQGSILTNNGQITIQALQNIANNGGKIGVQGSGNIIITAQGDIDNRNLGDQQGQIVTPAGFVQITANSLNNNKGQIGALTSGDITLSLGQDLQNENGKIITPLGFIHINSGAIANNNGQILTSSGELTLRSGDIENSNGVIQATDGNIKAEISNYTDSNSGLIYAGKHLQINASGDMSISNAIQGGEGLSLSAQSLSLSNAEASLSSLSGNGMIMLVNGLINVGTIFVNQGELSIIAGSINNQNQISTNAGSLSIAANNGDLSNHSGRILTKNDAITLTATGKLDNSASGQIGSLGNGNITLKSGDLNNQSGLIRTSVGDVSLDVGSLNNNNGSILTASGTMRVNALQGINNNSGQIGTQQNGNVTITANGAIDNRQGHFVTPVGLLKITGNALDNSSGQIGSNNGNVDIDVHSGRLINSSGTIIAGTDNNSGDLTLTSGDVENSGGTLQATNGSVNATIGSYTDTEKGVVYAGKDLQFNASGDVSIANAIQSQDQFTLQANSLTLTNSEASLSSLNKSGSVKIVQDLINNGSIYSSLGGLEVAAASLKNSGSLYGKSLVTLTIGQSLQNAGIFTDNKLTGGMIQSDGDVSLTATSMENTGFIQSLQGVTLQFTGDIHNQSLGEYSGIIQSGHGKSIQINAQNLQNENGQILSDAGLNLTIINSLTNSGYLQANTAINLTTPNLNNNGGSVLALGGDLTIGASQPTFIDNSNGKIQANGNIIIHGSSYQSSDQSFLTAQDQLQADFSGDVTNNGQMVGGSALSLNANSLSNGALGLIYSANGDVDLTVLGQNGLSNSGNIQAAGENSQLSIKGSILNNQGVILSKNGAVLDISQALNNQRNQDIFGRIITQNGGLIINSPIVNNDGLMISPADLTINTQTLTNTGYVSADHALRITAENSIVNNAASSGLIFNDTTLVSGSLIGGNTQLTAPMLQNQNGWIQGNDALTLTANNITNSQKGVILSTKGDVTLQNIGSTQGNILPVTSVVNRDSTIQAYNRLWVATQNLDNTNGVLSSDSGNIRLDQGSTGAALQSFNNAGGTLQSSKDLNLSFSQLESALGSKILAGGLLTLTIGSDFINNGTLWGGKGLNLSISSLVNNAGSIIGADNGSVTINAQHGNVTNKGVIKNLENNAGNVVIQAQNLTNDNGSILSNSNIDLQLSGALSNQNGGEITAYNQGNIHFTGSGFESAGLMLAGGQITGNISGDIHNTANGYIYGSQGLTLTSNTQIKNDAGQIGTDTGGLSLSAPILSFAKGGQIITSNGNISLNAASGMSNQGWLQGMGDIQITTPTLDNSDGAIVSMKGGMGITRDQNGGGLDQFINKNGTLQSAGDLTLYTQNLQNQGGKILTFAALGNNILGNISLYANAQGDALQQLDLSNNGVIQASKDMSLAVQSSGLSSTGSVIANQTLTAILNGDVNHNNVVFASLGATQGSGVHLSIRGDYSISEDGGLTSGGDLSLTANNITNNGVLIAANDVTINTGNLVNNATGLLSSTNNMTITASGNIDNNQGVIQADQGSMIINAIGDVTNTGGLIRTQSANGDITLTANSFENKYFGELSTEYFTDKLIASYNTAINAEGQAYAGMSNKEVADTYTKTTGAVGLGQYYYSNNVKILKVAAPEGLYTADGKPASGYVYYFLSEGAGNPNTRVEITASGTQTTLKGNSAIISAGRDLKVTTTGAITNDVSHIEAGRNMQLTGASLENIGHQNDMVFEVACYNKQFCRTLDAKDSSELTNPYFGDFGGHSMTNPKKRVWGANTVNTGLSGSIVAGGALIGQFSGQVNNSTIIEHALDSDFTNSNPTLPSGKDVQTTDGTSGKDGLTGPGNSELSSDGSGSNSSLQGQDNNLSYSGVTNPQGVDPGLHVNLPGFNGSGSTSVSDILSSLTGGQALFRPNPNVSNSDAGLNNISGGGIHNGNSNTGNGGSGGVINNASNNQDVAINNNIPNVQSPNNTGNNANNNTSNIVSVGDVASQNVVSPAIDTSSVNSNSNYLIETRPQYTSVNEFYGSQYLLNHLSINGSYTFLGDSGFDTQYIQQQYIQATGQSYPGGTYMTASDAMKTLLDNAVSQSDKLGLTIGTALTPEQQAALDEDIVWYEPVIVDGKTVLAPKLYLSPKTDVLAGAAIKGKDVSITAGSINNSGLMQGTNSIALTATNGDISNIGGTIKGGNISLNAQNGSVINSDTVNNYLVNGGTGSYLGSQGQILASGTLGIQASDSITTHGGTIQSGSDLAMKAGSINIGAAELNAAASSVTHSSDGTLAFNGNQTKNHGTSIKAGGNANIQTTTGDLNLSGSTLNAGGNVSLSSAGNIGLNAVTDSGLSDVKGKKSGAFNSSSFETKRAYTNEIGSTINSGGQLDVVAKKDVTISGGLAATKDVNIIAKEGSITENALTSTSDSYDYHHTKKTGFFGNETGLSAQVGTKKNTDKNTKSSVTHTGSIIASTGGNVNMSANSGDININGSKVLATQDINMTANNVNFNTVTNKTNGDHYQKDSFTGLTVGASGMVTDASKAGFNITNATDTQGQAFASASGAFPLLQTGLGEAGILGQGSLTNVNSNLFGVSATVGHSSSTTHTTTATTTDVGSTVSAGGKVNITAKNDINATGSNISGNDVIFNAGGDVNLNAGYKTTDNKITTSSNSFGVGANASIGIKGTPQASLTGSFNLSSGNSKSSSTTAIDTVVNGNNSVVINNKNGSLNINGAQITNKTADGTISDGSITINTGNLNITSPQNTSKYDSTTVSGGLSASVPVVGDNYTNVQPNIGYKGIHNDYKSTGETMSGLYAGKGGLDVNVSGTTTLTGGAITSAADADKNQITTGSLIANSLDNKDKWSGLNASASMAFNSSHNLSETPTKGSDQTILAPGSVLSSAGIPALSSNSVSHDKTSTTVSTIGDNITINTGSTTGTLSRDPDTANGHLDSTFNVGQINSDLNTQKTVGQLMGQYTNMAIEAVGQNDNFKPGSIGKMGLDVAVGAGTAAMGGGNIGSTVAGAAAGDAMNSVASDLAQSAADAMFPQDQTLKQDHKDDVDVNAQDQTQAKDKFPFNQQDQTNSITKKPIQDSTSDGNKIVNSIVQGLLTGSAGAAAGAITSNSGNTAVDVVNSTTSAMAQSRPKVDDPDVVAAEAAQKPIREQNLANATKSVMNVVNSQNTYSNEGAFMTALYNSLNPDPSKQITTQPSAEQISKVNNVLAHQGDYKNAKGEPDNTAFANALNNAFRNVSK